MKFGFRIPSLKKRILGSSSLKRKLGFRAPKGFGVITNPKKALYNKVYNKTTIGIESLGKQKKRKNKQAKNTDYIESTEQDYEEVSAATGCFSLIVLIIILFSMFYLFIKGCS